MNFRAGIWKCLILASWVLSFAGCASDSNDSPDGQVIKITAFNRSYDGVIAAKPPPADGEKIKIFVGGMVTAPGEYEVSAGTTILQAIQIAGGFKPLAAAKDLRVINKSGEKIKPGLYRLNRFRKLPLVWFGNPQQAQDFLLEDGMSIAIPIYL